QATSYYDDEGWQTFDSARPALEAALVALKRIGFETYWEQNIRPVVAERAAALRAELAQRDIVAAIEARLGRRLASPRITVYLLYYSEPHGIKIVGTNFITHYSYPTRIVLRNAIHEMMHPPYDPKDSRVLNVIAALRKDPYLMDKAEHHDAS